MPKSAYWSLICFPLAIALTGLLYGCDKIAESQALGLTIMTFYLFILQLVWAHLALNKLHGAGDIVFIGWLLIGAAFTLGLIILRVSEVHSNQLALGALLSPIVGYHLAGPIDKLCRCCKSA